jgi:4-alpha-glucanotransferase
MKVLLFAFGGDGTHEYLPHNYAPTRSSTPAPTTPTRARLVARPPPAERHFAGSYLACARATTSTGA